MLEPELSVAVPQLLGSSAGCDRILAYEIDIFPGTQWLRAAQGGYISSLGLNIGGAFP